MLPADYQAALDTIFNYVDYERRRSVPYDEAAWNLDRARRVLAALGNPHEELRFVHVAGSKGKGSTAAMIEAILRAAGLRTGFYTSPHLHTFRERIRVQGQLLERAELVSLLAACKPAIEAVPGITTFEIITVLALLHFARRQVEWGVLEVGLGGRLDATNVVTPAVSVITPISHEHTALLGETLAEIAAEKAGIIKPGVPVVSAPQAEEVLTVIRRIAQAQAASLAEVGRDWIWQKLADGPAGQTFDLSGPPAAAGLGDLSRLHIPLLGGYQLANAASAIAACSQLKAAGVPIDAASVRRGLAGVVWPGRLEVLQQPGPDRPVLVVDSAHTEQSASLLRAALAGYFPGRPLRLVFGASRDKDLVALLRSLARGASQVVLTRSRHPRATPVADLAAIAAQQGLAGRLDQAGNVAAALDLALAAAGPADLICVTGSLFVAAEGREAWLARHPDSLPPSDWARQAEPPDPDWQVSQKPSN